MFVRRWLFFCCVGAILGAAPSAHAEDKAVMYRQRPGEDAKPTEFPPFVYESVPDIESSASDFVPVPDRWRQFYAGKWYDPYNQNVLKADIPIFGAPGQEWFFETSIISDTLLERRTLPLPVGGVSTERPGSNNTFGSHDQFVTSQTIVASFSLLKGNTSFKPPDMEFRITPAFNFNYVDIDEQGVLYADPDRGSSRSDDHLGFTELFADFHLSNLTPRYDFISSRIGIQKFISDFRGFIYSDEAPGLRFFGNYDNNRWQYNLAWFSRLEKDTNSGINSFDSRHEDVFVANLFRQDAPVLGHTAQLNIVHRDDRAGDFSSKYDNNGFLVRPAAIGDERDKNVYSTYFGLTGDGHFGRINSSTALYYVSGHESHNAIAGRDVDISAGMAALELSYDIDWIRLRGSAFWASGDRDPFDGRATGFDAISDNPNFAGGDLSYWQRLGIPLIGGGGVFLTNRNSLLPDLKPGKEHGQANFVNPGIRIFNLGVDLDLTPKLKLVNNASYLQFDDTSVLETLRQDGSIPRGIGFDFSTGLLYRPFLNNNVILRVGTSALVTNNGFENLFGDRTLYDVFGNVILQY